MVGGAGIAERAELCTMEIYLIKRVQLEGNHYGGCNRLPTYCTIRKVFQEVIALIPPIWAILLHSSRYARSTAGPSQPTHRFPSYAPRRARQSAGRGRVTRGFP